MRLRSAKVSRQWIIMAPADEFFSWGGIPRDIEAILMA